MLLKLSRRARTRWAKLLIVGLDDVKNRKNPPAAEATGVSCKQAAVQATPLFRLQYRLVQFVPRGAE